MDKQKQVDEAVGYEVGGSQNESLAWRCRQEFERYAKEAEDWTECYLVRDGSYYKDSEVSLAWHFWQASWYSALGALSASTPGTVVVETEGEQSVSTGGEVNS